MLGPWLSKGGQASGLARLSNCHDRPHHVHGVASGTVRFQAYPDPILTPNPVMR